VGELAGARLPASFWLQTLEPTTGKAILTAREAVHGTINTAGRGRAVLIGTFAGHAATAGCIPDTDAIEKLLLLAGVHFERVDGLLVRRTVHENQQAWFYINPTKQHINARIKLDGRKLTGNIAGNAVADDDGFSVSVPPADIACVVTEG